MLFSKKVDILFYVASHIDEIWIRSTIKHLKNKKVRICLLVSNNIPENLLEHYRQCSIELISIKNARKLKKYHAKILVSPSTNILKSTFSEQIKYFVHMPHSLVSLHGVYLNNSFDAYNCLFAAGSHHVREFEELSAIRGLEKTRIFHTGYGKFDELLTRSHLDNTVNQKHVLIAPSWGEANIIETIGYELINQLIGLGYKVTLRPHSMFYFEKKNMLEPFKRITHPFFLIEDFSSCWDSLFNSNILITDFSGVAFEYHYIQQRKIIFVDTNPKILNSEYSKFTNPLVEFEARKQIGLVSACAVKDVISCVQTKTLQATGLRDDFVYNKDNCGKVAVTQLMELLQC